MAYAFVGTAGVVDSFTTSGAPTFGAGESRTAGNLLIAWAFTLGTTSPTASAGWTQAFAPVAGGTSGFVGVWYKIAAGSDAAPTITGTTGSTLFVAAAEFSGNATSSPADQAGSASAITSPQTATAAGADVATGELVIVIGGAWYSASATKTTSHTVNNGTYVDFGNNDSLSQSAHYRIGYAITTTNAGADNDQFAFTTTMVTAEANAVASFLLPGAAPTVIPDVVMAPCIAA